MRFQNQGDLKAQLKKLTPEHAEDIRKDAIAALAQRQTSSREIVAALIESRDNDPSPKVREQAAQALAENTAHQIVLRQYPELKESKSEQQDETFTAPKACTICGRQDETVRLAVFPYVYSLLVVTFTRGFAGIWCEKHRHQKQLLAGLITALGGWWGIPFGLFRTPKALFQIARGGIMPPEPNAELLYEIARARLEKEDIAGALRCLEASAQLKENPATLALLRELRAHQPNKKPPLTLAQKGLLLLGLLASVVVLGGLIGVLDYAITWGFSQLIQEEVSLLAVFLTWAPFVTLLFLGGVLFFQRLERSLVKMKCCNGWVGASTSLLLTLLALYSVLQGTIVVEYGRMLMQGAVFGSTGEALFNTLFVLTIGGPISLLYHVENAAANSSSAIYLGLLAVAALFYAGLGIDLALQTTRRQRQLVTLRETTHLTVIDPAGKTGESEE
jgi:hypothetical protein